MRAEVEVEIEVEVVEIRSVRAQDDGWAGVVLAAGLAAGGSYVLSPYLPVTDLAQTVWKGLGVGLLAVYAGLVARDRDGWLLTLVLALGALGDVLLEVAGLVTGAFAFLAGHLVAIWLYLRNRRETLSFSQKTLAIILVPATVGLAFMLPGDRAMAPGIALYSLGLAVMAATAWTSRFSRYGVGTGALMFVVSDLLIFARTGPLEGAAWTGFAVWALYFLGQTLICLGVTGRTPLRPA